MHVAVVCDYLEENWPSMDLVGEMLVDRLRQNHAADVQPSRLCPPMVRYCSGPGPLRRRRSLYNADRLVNRFWKYPSWIRTQRNDFDLFHLVDHSYSQLVHELPGERTLITCHDLEAFRGALEPAAGWSGSLHKHMARRIVAGFRKAAHVTCDSRATMDELLSYDLVAPGRASVVPNGYHPSCTPDPDPAADREIDRLLGPRAGAPELLNVGTTIPRKGVDFLLQVFAEVRGAVPNARLIRAGGPFTSTQLGLIRRLGIGSAIEVLPFLERPVLAAAYRRAALVLQPSTYEGFGLPIVEAMACGASVIASDIPVFREVAGSAATYCPLQSVPAWKRAVVDAITELADRPDSRNARRAAAIGRAANFTWDAYAFRMAGIYRSLLNS